MNKVKILEKILVHLAKKVLNKYQPEIIAVGGSVGKTSTKNVIAKVLSEKFTVGKTIASFNTELGVMAIVLTRGNDIDMTNYHYWSRFKQILFWLLVIFKGVLLLLPYKRFYPQKLVLELGEDKPGDINFLVNIVKPKISVLTAMGEIPAHVGFYDSPQSSVRENELLVSCLPGDGLSILNFDDIDIRKMVNNRVKNLFFSIKNEKSDVFVDDIKLNINFNEKKEKTINLVKSLQTSLSFKFKTDNEEFDFVLPNVISIHQIYAYLPALALAKYYNIDLLKVRDVFQKIEPTKQRMYLYQLEGGKLLIDDSYNSSPIAAIAALQSLGVFAINYKEKFGSNNRRVAILGDMLELGKWTTAAHQKVGREINENNVDFLITIGKSAYIISDEAIKNGFIKEKVKNYNDINEFLADLHDLIKDDDIILIKGSRGVGLKKAVQVLTEKIKKR